MFPSHNSFPATLCFPRIIFPCHITLPSRNFLSATTSLTRGLRVLRHLLRENTLTLSHSRISAGALFPQSVHATLQGMQPLTSPQPQPGGRTFRQAQPEGSIPLVPFVLAATPTRSWNARRPNYGITPTRQSRFDLTRYSPCETENWSAVTGSAYQVAPVPHTTSGTSALAVLPPLTELRSALELRKSQALIVFTGSVLGPAKDRRLNRTRPQKTENKVDQRRPGPDKTAKRPVHVDRSWAVETGLNR
jgi:hypothetical protein